VPALFRTGSCLCADKADDNVRQSLFTDTDYADDVV